MNGPVNRPVSNSNKFSAIVFAPLAIIVLVLTMSFSAHSSANANPATPAASPNAAPNASPSPDPQGQVIYCASDNMRRNYCAADVRGGVQLIRQRSDSPCIFNRTWGFVNGRGIWVDRGCRADFQITRPNWGGWDNGYNIYCASDNGGRNVCPTDTRGGVQLIRQRSGSACDYGRTWGYDRRGIWVDRGCRADFQIGGGGGNGGGGGGWNPGPGTQVITCSSNDGRRNYCPVSTRGGVRLVRQRSDSDCIFNSTWGYDHRGVWVDRGCRADFEVGNLR
jgi:Protein of unknown function (DUF3011)